MRVNPKDVAFYSSWQDEIFILVWEVGYTQTDWILDLQKIFHARPGWQGLYEAEY